MSMGEVLHFPGRRLAGPLPVTHLSSDSEDRYGPSRGVSAPPVGTCRLRPGGEAMSANHREWDLSKKLGAGLMVACAVVTGSVASAAPKSKVVATDNGPVRGIVTPTMEKFLGIPYAAAPVGDLRWRPPQPHAPWDSPLDASTFGAHCPQPPTPFGRPSVTEDCLFLNVYTPPKINHG